MIITPTDPGLASALLDSRFKRRFLAEGDSWFSIGGFTANLLMAIDDADTLIVNCSAPGDTLENMVDMGSDAFSSLLEPTEGIAEWTAILLSAGGNDLLGKCDRFIYPSPSDPVVEDNLTEVLSNIEYHLVRLLRLCQATRPGVPVFMHTYDYPPVARRWWWWQSGPWVSPILRQAHIPRERWNTLAAGLIDALAERLGNIADDYPSLRIVDTRGRLLSAEWRNEIHPSFHGYRLLASMWRAMLDAAIHPERTAA